MNTTQNNFPKNCVSAFTHTIVPHTLHQRAKVKLKPTIDEIQNGAALNANTSTEFVTL